MLRKQSPPSCKKKVMKKETYFFCGIIDVLLSNSHEISKYTITIAE
jgi:hypothetical protein